MSNPLLTKLRNFAHLGAGDATDLANLSRDVRRFKAGDDLIREGEQPHVVFLLLEGWACRYKILPNGSRQIMAYLLPGDLCDIHIYILNRMDHSIGLLSDAKVAVVPRDRILDVFDRNPSAARALWWSTLTDEAVLREWIVNIGRRDAFERVSHLFAELWLRLRAVGRTDDNAFDVPLTQTDIGDTLGLTPVHVNRTLQRMRSEGLIILERGRATIPDVSRLMEASGFQPNYLHLEAAAHA